MPAYEGPDRRSETEALFRLERKMDELGNVLSEVQKSGDKLASTVEGDRRLQEQYNIFTQQTITRLQDELDGEKEDRKDGDLSIRATLAKVSFALFSGLVTLIVGVIIWLLTSGGP